MNASELEKLAEVAFKALQAACPEPLDMMLILGDKEDVATASKFPSSGPDSRDEQMRIMLRYYCAALSMLVEQCETPEELIDEIGAVLRRDIASAARPPQ